MAKNAAKMNLKKGNVGVKPKCKKILHKMSEFFEKGVIVIDSWNQAWEIMEPIGQGGFGAVYSSRKAGTSTPRGGEDAKFAIKIEPHESGPLFTEMHFFIRFLKPNMINSWKQEQKLSFLGIPEFIGHGSHVHKDVHHRFLVMDRYGGNINEKLYDESRKLNVTNLKLFLNQIVDALNYIHSQDYFHGDIKPENLLLRYNSTANEVYLVDYGLASSCTKDKELKPDKKKMHNGTLLYCSRDAHLGVETKRSDMETLAFNILMWHDYPVPWKDVTDPKVAHEKKVAFMSDISCLRDSTLPEYVIQYLEYINKLQHLDTPDYKEVKRIFSTDSAVKKPTTSRGRPRGTSKAKSPAKKREHTPEATSANAAIELGKRESPEGTIGAKRKSESGPEHEDESPPKRVLRGKKVSKLDKTEKVNTKKSKRAVKEEPPKMSWRDFPTVKGSTSVQDLTTVNASTRDQNESQKMSWRDFPTVKGSRK